MTGVGPRSEKGSLDRHGQGQAQLRVDGLPLVSCSGGRVAECGDSESV